MKLLKNIFRRYYGYYYILLLSFLPKTSNLFSSKNILINSSRADSLLIDYDYLLAKLFVSNGARVFFIVDDGKTKFNSLLTIRRKSSNSSKRNYIILNFLIRLFKGSKITLLNYSTISSKMVLDNEDNNKVDVEKHVKSTLSRYYQGSECFLDNQSKEYIEIVQKIKMDSEDSMKVAKWCIQNIKPDAFVTTHAIYSKWGPAYEYMKAQKIPTVVVLESGYVGKKFLFSSVPHEILHSDNRFDFCKSKSNLTEKEREWSIQYLNSRVNISASDNVNYFNKSNFVVLDNINKSNTFLMCPNVVWDGNIKDRDLAFDSLQDWIYTTLDFFLLTPSIRLILRCHPSEVSVCKGSLKLEEIIIKKYGSLNISENITIIKSSANVNTYDLIKKVSALILYDGMLALESAFLKTPVVICGKGRYYANHIGIDIITKEQYFNLLSNFNSIIQCYDVTEYFENALRYINCYCANGNYPLPHLDFSYDGKDRTKIIKWLKSNDTNKLLEDFSKRISIH